MADARLAEAEGGVEACERSRAEPVEVNATRPAAYAHATASVDSHPAARVLALQRAVGNRATGRLLQREPWWYEWATEQASAIRDYLLPAEDRAPVRTDSEELDVEPSDDEGTQATPEAIGPSSALVESRTKRTGRSRTRIPKVLSPEDIGEAPGVTKSVVDGTPHLAYEDELVGSGEGWVQISESPGIEVVPGKAEKQWALPAVASDLRRIGALWHERHPDHPIRVGDVSKRGGGPLKTGPRRYHKSHQNGVDMDIGFMRTDADRRRGVRFDNPASNYSQELTEELLDLFIKESTIGVEYIFFADPFVEQYGRIGRSKKSNAAHTKHVHIRLHEPYGEELPSWLQ